MATCLPKSKRNALLQALREGEVSIDSLYDMTSQERNDIFRNIVGSDFSDFVNARFEQAMTSNQKKAMARWIEQTTQPKSPVRRSMMRRVERNERFLRTSEEDGFLRDLAEEKLGVNVTQEEADQILNLKTQVDELRASIPENSPKGSEERLAYGMALDDYKQYLGNLKRNEEAIPPLERLKPSNYWRNVLDFSGTAKSFAATLDNSFIGRQGIKTLYRGNLKTWGNTFLETFRLFGKELVAERPGLFKERDSAAMKALRADIFSRPNATNGKYTAAKNGYGLGLDTEEAFPSSLPERIPVLGRVFKASETAFNGGAMRMRADLADAVIDTAEKNGVDMLDERQATSFGKLVASMTGRGDIGKAAAVGEEVNALMFSVRFLKSNFDTLTAHQFDRSITPEARKAAAMNTLRIATGLGATLGTADALNPGSVEWDPRSSNFGEIELGNNRYDVSGGMNGLVTLAARLVPTVHNGEWGLWSKSPTTGEFTKLSDAGFGEQTALDVFENFWEGKLSPAAGVFRDVWRGQNFQGEKPDFVNTSIGLVTPISAEMLIEEIQRGNDDMLGVMIAEGLGISPRSTTFGGYGDRWRELRDTEDARTYNNALKDVTNKFNERADRLRGTSRWKRMSNEEQTQELEAIRRDATNEVLSRFGIQ